MPGTTYPVAAGKIAAHDKTLSVGVADTVQFHEDVEYVEVLTDGTAAVYFTTDGSAATVSGTECYKIPAGKVSRVAEASRGGGTEVSIISSSAVVYSVTRVESPDCGVR